MVTGSITARWLSPLLSSHLGVCSEAPAPCSMPGSDLLETPSISSSDSELEIAVMVSPHAPRKPQTTYLSLTVALEAELWDPFAECWADISTPHQLYGPNVIDCLGDLNSLSESHFNSAKH